MSGPLPPSVVLAEGMYARLIRRGTWEYVERHGGIGAVAIVAVTPAGRLLLTEQFRMPVERRVIELPAGLVGDQPEAAGETIDTAALRELLEETGYAAERIVTLAFGPPSAGLTSELVWLVRAEGLVKRHAGGGDAGEAITVHEVPVRDVPAWLERAAGAGQLVDVKVYAALHFLHTVA
jgi:ADP-ribose pyrophosphatase